MKAKIDYRRMLMDSVCKQCVYHNICGLGEEYDCKALKKLVEISEDLDMCNPNI